MRRGKEKYGDSYSVLYQVVEPNPNSVKTFRGVVENNENYSHVAFKWFTGFFEAFLEEFSKIEKGRK